jgi:chondroitin sulfate N-acetylgalactosaminyltransferase 1/2
MLRPLPLEPLTKEYSDVIDFTLNQLNSENGNKKDDDKKNGMTFVEGFSLCDRKVGIIYDVYTHQSKGKNSTDFRKMTLFRPFGPVQKEHSTSIAAGSKWVNVILPLQGKLETFKIFLTLFRFCCMADSHIFLTVVCFGEKDSRKAKIILQKVTKAAKFHNYAFLIQNESFSREKGINYAVNHWKKGNDIMAFFDVDVVFKADFIERCRMNTDSGKRVYFPIVFSLYNPKMVYEHRKVPPVYQQLDTKADRGFWRIRGYGIACQYRDDYLEVRRMRWIGDNWGREGVELYRGYECLGLDTKRSFDRGVFHLYQERKCDDRIGDEEYRDCLETKAIYEVSHMQIGLLVFKSAAQDKGRTMRMHEQGSFKNSTALKTSF